MLKLLAQILKQMANFDLVGTATNGGQALRQVSALSLNLVLMDVHCQVSTGYKRHNTSSSVSIPLPWSSSLRMPAPLRKKWLQKAWS